MISRGWILTVVLCSSLMVDMGYAQSPLDLRETGIGRAPASRVEVHGRDSDRVVIPAPGPEVGFNVEPNRPIPAYSSFLGSETGNLSVDWVVPQSFIVGQEAEFELVLRNHGPVAVEQIEITPTLPDGFQFLGSRPQADFVDKQPIWRVATLGPQQEARIQLQLQPQRVGNARGHARVTFSTASSTAFNVVEPKLKIAVEAPATAVAGSQAIFHVTVTNPGSGKAENVTLDVNLSEGLERTAKSTTYGLGVLNPGESRAIRIAANVTKLGKLPAEFVAAANNGLRDTANREVTGLGARLEVALDGPDFRYVTRPADYTVRVRNTGTTAAENVDLRCSVPKPFAFLSAEQQGSFDAATKNVNWFLGRLDVDQEVEVDFLLQALAPGEFPILASAHAERGLSSEARHVTRVDGIAAILLEVVDVDDPIEVGAETMYEILVTNQGTEFTTNLQIDVIVPNGLVVSDSTGPTQGRVDGQSLRFDALPRLAPRADAVYRLKVRGTDSGDFRLEVHATADSLESPVTELESTKVYQD